MTHRISIAISAAERSSSEFLLELVKSQKITAIQSITNDSLSAITQQTLAPKQVVVLPKESCRVVVQGDLSLDDVSDCITSLNVEVVRTHIIDDLLAQKAIGAVVLGLAEAPHDLTALQALAADHKWEVNLLEGDDISTQAPGVLLMDMDSTAIQIECIDEIAKLAGVGEQVSEVTELAMQGKLDFAESLRARVATLKDADEGIIASVRNTLPMSQGLPELVKALQAAQWKVAIASGGFTYFADYLKDQLGLDAAYANELEIIDGKLTGQVKGGIVDAQKKADVLLEIADQHSIPHARTVAAGDGANDLVMMAASGLGVAFHAKEVVAVQATTAIKYNGLEGVYYIIASAP
ncbi:phosphoserine phosphatase SerB [Echinimonas agarilytica]|uniref:Phosphoserine phosphatase n=1 Tax=Echinimonas agarilytica TaxID=1215918 RepID=A0AA42B823_9GAMM|nr:phosphoserine phosphatase SerB [Echinimonas agarilytica]MCM2680527.1 phosphoserine phosphatase SerB [Echinimonas agarilytica]